MAWCGRKKKNSTPQKCSVFVLCSLEVTLILVFFSAVFIPPIPLVGRSQSSLFAESGLSLGLPTDVRAVPLPPAPESRSGFVPSLKVKTG